MSRAPSAKTIDVGVLLWSQGSDWQTLREVATFVDGLGYAHLWTWDHLLPIFGDQAQPIFEGWTILGALAAITHRVDVGLLVGANTFRNPAIVVKSAITVDHISGGRAILGLGGGWFEPEHEAFGIEFGETTAVRLGWLDEAIGIIRALVDGERIDHDGPRYRTRALNVFPRPIRARLPIMVGGVGERITLRTVARHADMWNAYGSTDALARKAAVLRDHCDREGRDPSTIEFSVACKPFIRSNERDAEAVLEQALVQNRTSRHQVADDPSFWVGKSEQIAERMIALRHVGFTTFIAQVPAPYDRETIERFIGEVKPLVDGA